MYQTHSDPINWQEGSFHSKSVVFQSKVDSLLLNSSCRIYRSCKLRIYGADLQPILECGHVMVFHLLTPPLLMCFHFTKESVWMGEMFVVSVYENKSAYISSLWMFVKVRNKFLSLIKFYGDVRKSDTSFDLHSCQDETWYYFFQEHILNFQKILWSLSIGELKPYWNGHMENNSKQKGAWVAPLCVYNFIKWGCKNCVKCLLISERLFAT